MVHVPTTNVPVVRAGQRYSIIRYRLMVGVSFNFLSLFIKNICIFSEVMKAMMYQSNANIRRMYILHHENLVLKKFIRCRYDNMNVEYEIKKKYKLMMIVINECYSK